MRLPPSCACLHICSDASKNLFFNFSQVPPEKRSREVSNGQIDRAYWVCAQSDFANFRLVTFLKGVVRFDLRFLCGLLRPSACFNRRVYRIRRQRHLRFGIADRRLLPLYQFFWCKTCHFYSFTRFAFFLARSVLAIPRRHRWILCRQQLKTLACRPCTVDIGRSAPSAPNTIGITSLPISKTDKSSGTEIIIIFGFAILVMRNYCFAKVFGKQKLSH